ncbi:NUDIX domain-containing protein [candidate division WWE3 bacterium]|uniref:NUDIX domain-containing protein n=1 Tax=candidate division WWE3 bacterium TaxID=2053526 RepID=A0A955RRX6_UNCKA|nr:NUDIX domain-containing protein [candidate division WWE3 bacterium]
METEELLDWVDENDQVIGEVERSVANSDPKYIHREVGILIHDAKGRVLVQRRSFKKKTDPGVWIMSVAGHVKSGVSPEQTAHEELREELGFDTDLKFIEKSLEKHSNETIFAYMYVGLYNGEPIIFDEDETEAVMFLDKDEFSRLCKNETVEEISKDYFLRYFKR